MRTALLLLLMLALAAVPGSLVPQTSSNPNAVAALRRDEPELAGFYEAFQLFDVYTSAWFSAIYLLLFISLIGCVLSRSRKHAVALLKSLPPTPRRLSRMPAYLVQELPAQDCAPESAHLLERAAVLLKKSGYRTARFPDSIAAEKGYLRESANLLFHLSLLALVILTALGSFYGFTAQRLVITGSGYANTVNDFDVFRPGRLFNGEALAPYRLSLDQFSVTYGKGSKDFGLALDYRADVTIAYPDKPEQKGQIRVNEPLRIGDESVYLLGNGYAPHIRVYDPEGKVIFDEKVPFIPQDDMLTSLGVVKVHQGLKEQLGMIGFFYPTQGASREPFFSAYPGLGLPLLTLNVYRGELASNESVYSLNTDPLTQIAGGKSGVNSLILAPGQSQELPEALGKIEFVNLTAGQPGFENSVARYAAFDIHAAPMNFYIFLTVLVLLASLLVALFLPRRRLWVRVVSATAETPTPGKVEIAGLARGHDPALERCVAAFAERLLPPKR